MTYLIIGIILLTIIISYFIEDINKFFKIHSIITIISGYLTIFITIIINIIIKNKLSFINVSKITNIISIKGINRGLILILLGALELITYILLNVYNRYKLNKT